MSEQADGSIRIETTLDTSGFLKGKREVESSAKEMGQNVEAVGASAEKTAEKIAQTFSGSGQQIDQQTEKVENLNSALDKLGSDKHEIPITRWNDASKVSDYGGPLRVDDGKNEKYMPLHPADPSLTIKTDPLKDAEKTVNELRQGIENLKAEMKSMEKSGKWWGDADYDKAAVKLEQMQQAAKDYKAQLYSPTPDANPFGLNTLDGKVREAELALNRLSQAGKGLGDADYDKAYQNLAKLNAEAREYKKELVSPVSNPFDLDTLAGRVREAEIELQKCTQVGKGLGDADYDRAYQNLAKLNAEAREYKKTLVSSNENPNPFGLDTLAGRVKAAEIELQKCVDAGKGLGDADYDKAYQNLAKLNAEAKTYRKSLTAPNPNPFGLDTLPGKIREAELDLDRLTKAGKGLGDADYDRAYQKLARLTAEAREYKKALTDGTINKSSLSGSIEKVTSLGSRLQKSTKTLASSVTQAFKKIKTQAASAAKSVKNLGSAILKMAGFGGKMDKASNSMAKALKMLMRYGLGVRSTYVLINKFRSAIVAGFSNLAQYSESTNASISSMMSSLTRLKNALATAFAPILTVVSPILTQFIDMCSNAATQVGMFFAALAGQTSFTKAKAVQQDYAESLNKTSSSTNSAAKAAEKQAKALKKAQKAAQGSIASFDELNVIQHDTADTTDSTGDTAAKGLTPKDMFEEVPIKSKIKSFADRIKNLIKKQDWKGIGKLLGSEMNRGMKKVYDAINWKNIGPKIQKTCNAFTEAFNSLVDSLNWNLLGQTVGAGINTLVRTFNLLVGPGGIDFENLGKKISTGLRGMLDEVSWEEFGNAIGNKIMMLWNTLKGFMDDMTAKNSAGLTGWQQFGDAIANTFNGIFDRVSFKDLAHTAATGINGIFSALKEAVDKFNWEDFTNNLKSGISTFLSETSWKENGKALADFITHLCDAISAVATKENFKQLGEKIGEFLSELPWKTMLVTAGEAIMNGLTGIMEGLSETTAGSVAAAIGAALIGTRVVSAVTGAFKTLFGTAIVGGLNAALVSIPLSAFAGFKLGEFLSTNFLDGDKISAKDFVDKYIMGYEKGDLSGAVNEWFKDVLGNTKLDPNDLAVYQQWENAIMNMIKTAQISGEQGYQLLTYLDSLQSDSTGVSTALLAMQNKMDDLGVSTKDFSQAVKDVDLDSIIQKTGDFSNAIGEVETDPLIDKLESLRGTISKVEFADMVVKSANAIDEMGGIWENGKQILGEKALAIYAEICDGLEPDENGFYTLASGQMVQYGQAIEDSTGTLKEKTKATLDEGLKAGINECLPEQNQIGGEMGNYFVEGYTSALIGNRQLKSAYEEALKGVDTTVAQEQAKTTGEELGKNTGAGFQKGIDEVSDSVSDSVTGMMEKSVKEPAQKAVDSHSPSRWFAQLAIYCGQGFSNNLNNAFASTFSWFGNFRARIVNSIGSLYTVGYNFLIGMNNGIVAGAQVMYNNAKIIANNLSNMFRSAWKIHSPSQVAGEIGGYYMAGMFNEMQAGADKILSMFNNFASRIGSTKFDVPKLDIPVSYSPVTSAAYLNQAPLMAQGKAIPTGAVRGYSADKNSRAADIENAVERVMMRVMQGNNDNSGYLAQSFKEAMSGMAVVADGHIIGYLQQENQRSLDRGSGGLFPSSSW